MLVYVVIFDCDTPLSDFGHACEKAQIGRISKSNLIKNRPPVAYVNMDFVSNLSTKGNKVNTLRIYHLLRAIRENAVLFYAFQN